MKDVPFQLEAGESVAIQGAQGGVFTLLSHLASGASSQAWLARREDGLMGVLKTLRTTRQAGHELVIEEQILRQLRSRNLVKFLGRGERQGRLVLAYERVFQNPLLVMSEPAIRARLPRDPGTRYYPLPPRMALSLGLDLLRALEHMHALGFVHHDVKPANLMMRLPALERTEAVPPAKLAALASQSTPTGVLIDIGAARGQVFLDDFNRGEVDPGIVPPQLTLTHAPPEALLPTPGPHGNRPFLHPSLDRYAAALVIYAAVSGCGPYDHLEGESTSGLERVLAIKTREREGRLSPVHFRALAGAPGVDASLAEALFLLLKRCLGVSWSERPAVRQVRQELETLCVERGLVASGPRSGRLEAPSASAAAPPPAKPKSTIKNAELHAELERIEQRNKRPPPR